jgi:surfeit locus 1 family protein
MTIVSAPADPTPTVPPPSRAETVLKQVGIVVLGLLLAATMIGLGVWQLGVYHAQGQKQAQQRASAAPIALESVARPGEEVGDGYGRQVRFTGRYDPGLQEFVSLGSGDRYRVLTALRLPDGGILPVVRGVVTGRQAPQPPTEEATGTGILMPSEGADNGQQPGGSPTNVVLPSLAQKWNGSLVNGFVTLNAAEARAQSLEPATVELPTAGGRLRNGFYALQWWVFAGFAIWMSLRMARDFGRDSAGLMGGPEPEPPEATTEAAVRSTDTPDRDDSAGERTTT